MFLAALQYGSSVSHFRVFIEKSLSFECITILAALLLAIKLPNFKSVDEDLSELEPPLSHSFDKK